jgi:hypothetical protein
VHQLAAVAPLRPAWDERYRDEGLVTIGIHRPEFLFELVYAKVNT